MQGTTLWSSHGDGEYGFYSLVILEDRDYQYLPELLPSDDLVDPLSVYSYVPSETLFPIRSAIHYAAHHVLANSPIAHDEKINVFIKDYIEKPLLSKSILQELLLLVNEMQTEEAKTDILLELAPHIRYFSSNSLLSQYRNVAFHLPEDLKQKVLADMPD